MATWLGAGAALTLGVVLFTGRHGPIGWVVGVLAALYVLALVLRGAGPDPAAPLVGLGLLALAELAFDARKRRLVDHAGLSPAGRWTPAIVALGAVAVGAMLLIASQVAPRSSLGLRAAGVAAATGLFVLLARLSRR